MRESASEGKRRKEPKYFDRKRFDFASGLYEIVVNFFVANHPNCFMVDLVRDYATR